MLLQAGPLLKRTAFLLLLFAAGISRPAALAQQRPADFRSFLSQYAGKEILLINISSDSLQFFDADSTQRFVVVLDEVGNDVMIVHRTTGTDKRSFAYPLADIRRITYLFGGRPYKRIVVEMF
ncbi:MAG TPA: hypothetical protein VK569_02240 [Bacteroidota bacterium]|nr:hypothetical protein [Bacteroidota bacterium]